jgi:phage gpG-like protein
MAADPITVTVDPSRAIAKIERIPERVRSALRGTIVDLTQSLAELVRTKLSGGVLKVRSGRLLASITSTLVENTTSIVGKVETRGVPYAAIHEYGGTIHHPGSSKFQAWEGPDGWVRTHFTRPHDIVMPMRSYMRSSLEEMRSEIVARLTAAAHSGARAA